MIVVDDDDEAIKPFATVIDPIATPKTQIATTIVLFATTMLYGTFANSRDCRELPYWHRELLCTVAIVTNSLALEICTQVIGNPHNELSTITT